MGYVHDARPTTHYLNADFDLGLCPRPAQIRSPHFIRRVSELTIQGMLGAASEDLVLLRAEPPTEFTDYLTCSGVPVPKWSILARLDPANQFRPLGWSREAMELNAMHLEPVAHPTPECIRRVNSRSFSLELETELGTDAPPAYVVESLEQIEAVRARHGATQTWIVKSEHGNSGLANRRLRSGELSSADTTFVGRRLAEDDRMVIEPWLERVGDWCVVFDVPFDPRTIRTHEAVCTADGAFIGALFDEASQPVDLRARLIEHAGTIAKRLGAEGYFGPVCADALTWEQRGELRLRPLVDLNCRHAMSDGAHRLGLRLAPDRAFYYRFFNRRKLRLPSDLTALVAAFGERRYRAETREGILLASPLRLDPGPAEWRPAKLAVILVAGDRQGVFDLEQWFRRRFEG